MNASALDSLSESATTLIIVKRSLDKQAADLLRRRIVTGALGPGFRLIESQLSEQMGLSRGTVRAALNDLTHEGLVTQTAYTKWVVTEFSADDAWELFTLRSALEALAARLAAERINPGERQRLWAAFARLEAAAELGDWGQLTDADFTLHKTVIEVAQHSRLAHQYRLLEQQIRILIGTSNSLVPTLCEVVAQHRPLVEAIAAGRGARAERLARAHDLDEGGALVAHLKGTKRLGGARERTPKHRSSGLGNSAVGTKRVAKRPLRRI